MTKCTVEESTDSVLRDFKNNSICAGQIGSIIGPMLFKLVE